MECKCEICKDRHVVLNIDLDMVDGFLCNCIPDELSFLPYPPVPPERGRRWKDWKNTEMDLAPFGRNSINVKPFSDEEKAFFGAIEEKIKQIDAQNAEIGKKNAEIENIRSKAEARIRALRASRVPSKFLVEKFDIPSDAEDWFKKYLRGNKHSLCIYGDVGTGKTTIAANLLVRAILEHGRSGFFVKIDNVLEARKDAATASFNGQDKEKRQEFWEEIRRYVQSVDILVFDDIGRLQPTEARESAYTEIVDLRDDLGRPTIYTTNHANDATISLDGHTLKRQIGARAADRVLGSRQLHLAGSSRRRYQDEPENWERPTECEKVSQEIVEKFEIQAEESQSSCMHWLAQNPVFQVVSDQERKQLTDEQGADIDAPKRVINGVSNPGDSLTVWGPLLGMEDQLTYFALIEILQDRHRNGMQGTFIKTTFTEIREKLGVKGSGGTNTQQALRRLNRLHRARIHFKSHTRKGFMGGFIENVFYDGKTLGHEINIKMNDAMIKFYDAGLFSRIQIDKLRQMSDWGKVLHLYVESLADDRSLLPIKKLARLAGKETFDQKQLRKNARKAIDEHKRLGLQGSDAKLEKGVIHSVRVRSLSSLS